MRKFWFLSLLGAVVFAAMGSAVLIMRTGVVGEKSYQSGDGRSYYIQQGDTKAQYFLGGKMQVKESYTVYFNGLWRGFARQLPLGEKQQALQVQAGDQEGAYRAGASAEIGSDGAPSTWGSTLLPEGLQTVWHHQTQDSTKTFWQSFLVGGVGTRYKDADILQFVFWGDGWKSGVGSTRLTLRMPKSLPKSTTISLQPTWRKGQASFKGDLIIASTGPMPQGQAAAIQVRLPRGWLGPGIQQSTDNAPSPDGNGIRTSLFKSLTDKPLGVFLLWFFGLLLLGYLPLWLWMKHCKDKYKDAEWNSSGPVYEPPARHPLVYGYAGAEEQLPPDDRILSACIVDLIARGFYARENVRDEKGDWALQISIPAQRPAAPQSGGEAALLAWMDKIIGQAAIRLDQMEILVNPGYQSRMEYEAVLNKLKQDGLNVIGATQSHSFKTKLVGMFIPLPVMLLLDIVSFPVLGFNAMAVALTFPLWIVFGCWPAWTWKRSDFVYSGVNLSTIQGPWQAYRDWILNFSSMETAPALQVILWERAFAAALLWGVAEEFTAQVSKMVPDLPAQTQSLGYFSGYGASSWYDNMHSTLYPAASNTGGVGGFGGGGGFSGGGGGSFGGGGGGAW